jgi:hypothetical protein
MMALEVGRHKISLGVLAGQNRLASLWSLLAITGLLITSLVAIGKEGYAVTITPYFARLLSSRCQAPLS